MRLGLKSKVYSLVLTVCSLFVFLPPAYANIKQIKAYKEAFPDEKPKCSCCHTSDKPKKEDGQHDLNEYGTKVVAIHKEADAAAFKQAGKAPEAKS